MTSRPAYYARPGSTMGDLVTILHLPYTVWHLSYVAIGAGLAPTLDWVRLAGTLTAFAFGLGIGAHALDELHDRPLRTSLSDRALWILAGVGFGAAAAVAGVGVLVISPWVAVWAVAGVALAAAYSLEWSRLVHTDIGFALAWGAFPVVMGNWAQTEGWSLPAVLAALAATALSLAQRKLSTSAKRVRRSPDPNGADPALLASWEIPLRTLVVAVPLVALAILATHV